MTHQLSLPSVSELIYPIDICHVERIKETRGDDQRQGRCVFVGYSVEVQDVADVRAAYSKITRLHPNALHVVCAYRIPGVNFIALQGYADDGEHGAG